ncbi:MAG: hypothetical protein ACOY3L_00190 [Pseudomonadota bacterium]
MLFHIVPKSAGALILGAASLLVLPTAVFAKADPSQEIKTAAEYVASVAEAHDLTTAENNLHYTINCLVGPGGQGFDAKAFDPCKGMGDGAIPDVTNAAKKEALEDALTKVRAALAQRNLERVKIEAAAAGTLLQRAL